MQVNQRRSFAEVCAESTAYVANEPVPVAERAVAIQIVSLMPRCRRRCASSAHTGDEHYLGLC